MRGAVLLSASDALGLPDWAFALAKTPPTGWRVSWVEPAWLLLIRDETPLDWARHGAEDLRLGWFAQAPAAELLDGLAALNFCEAMRQLQGQAWGEYIYLRRTPATGRVAVYRDPGGGLDAFVWRVGAVTVCATEAPEWLDRIQPDAIALDWTAVAAFAIDPTRHTAGSALCGVHALAPGEAWVDGVARQVWRPADFLEIRPPRRRSSAEQLAEVVRDAVARSADGGVLLEVSGGLDSAVVAGCLPRGRLTCALNSYVRDPQGDERVFARQVAKHAGIPLTEVAKLEQPLDLEGLAAASRGFRPALNAFDQAHDADVAARCKSLGVEILMTGQGGDDVFFQTPTPAIVADGFRHGLTIAELVALAHWQGRSVYALLGAGLLTGLRGAELRLRRPLHVTDRAWSDVMAHASHPWLEDLDAAPAAKSMQVAGLANALIVKGPSLRSAASRVRHPLLSQPVIEYALGVSIPDLTRGRDRGLARQAFADAIPASIAQRPTKGRMTAHYGRVLAGRLGELRPLLLEGRLAGEGIVRTEILDRMLSAENLIWRAGYGMIINTLMVELWVRAWLDRLSSLQRRRAQVS